MLLLYQPVQIVWMPLRDFRNALPISDNKQWTAGDSGLPGLSGCYASSFCLDPLCFPSFWWLSDLVSFKHFLALFPRSSRLCPGHYLNAHQLNPIPPMGCYSHLKQEDPSDTPPLKRP
jgi:hypothetical protein